MAKPSRRHREFPRFLPCTPTHSLSRSRTPPEGHIGTTGEPASTDSSASPESVRAPLGAGRRLSLNGCTVHAATITGSGRVFTALEVLRPPFAPPTPLTPGGHRPLRCLRAVSSFPECHIAGLTRDCSERLLSLRNGRLMFLHVFPWLRSSCLFSAEKHSIVWTDRGLLIHPLLRDTLIVSEIWHLRAGL